MAGYKLATYQAAEGPRAGAVSFAPLLAMILLARRRPPTENRPA